MLALHFLPFEYRTAGRRGREGYAEDAKEYQKNILMGLINGLIAFDKKIVFISNLIASYCHKTITYCNF